MKDRFITNLDDVVLEFSMKKIAAYDSSWVDVDIKINSAVISYDLKNWEPDGEILDKADIKNDSEKKILNTSKLLAPTARKIPISFFFCEMDTEIKFDSNNAAKTARTNPTYRNTYDKS